MQCYLNEDVWQHPRHQAGTTTGCAEQARSPVTICSMPVICSTIDSSYWRLIEAMTLDNNLSYIGAICVFSCNAQCCTCYSLTWLCLHGCHWHNIQMPCRVCIPLVYHQQIVRTQRGNRALHTNQLGWQGLAVSTNVPSCFADCDNTFDSRFRGYHAVYPAVWAVQKQHEPVSNTYPGAGFSQNYCCLLATCYSHRLNYFKSLLVGECKMRSRKFPARCTEGCRCPRVSMAASAFD